MLNSKTAHPSCKRLASSSGSGGTIVVAFGNGSGFSMGIRQMPYTKYSPAEVESRGEGIYAQQIRHKVEAQNKGRFLVVDIETGEYEIDEEDLEATRRALAKRPDAVLYGLRIGHPTAYRLGGHVGTVGDFRA